MPVHVSKTAEIRATTSNQPATSNAAKLRDAAFAAAAKPPAHNDDTNAKFDLTPGSLKKFHAWMSNDWPKETEAASRMLVIPEPGMPAIRMLYNYYHSGKPMEAWIDSVPANGKLNFRVLIGVSWHNGEAAGNNFAKTNTYGVTAQGPTGSVRVPQFGPGISRTTEITSASDVITLDISKPGTYTIEAWPFGSAGVAGYLEGRSMILHVG